MNFPIYEFSKSFNATKKDINWVSKNYPEVLGYSKLRQEIEQEGLWVSGGYDGKYNLVRSSYPYVNGFPQEVDQTIKDKLFEIDKLYTPLPGAKKLLRNGYRIQQPPLESVALIAREIGDYCVLAVATSQLDDKQRDLVIGYRYFWLDVRRLTELISHNEQPDGILTLIYWWANKPLCFDMNPDSFTHEIWQGEKEKVFTKQKPYYPEDYPNDQLLQQLLLKVEDKTDFPPFILKNDQEIFNPDNSELIWETIVRFHTLALATNLAFENSPVAWAWNVRQVVKPETFNVIFCADEEAVTYFHTQKLSLSPRARKMLSALPAAVDPKNDDIGDDDQGGDNGSSFVKEKIEVNHVDQETTGTTANPDPLLIKLLESEVNRITINYKNTHAIQRFLESYFDSFDKKIEFFCWKLLLEKTKPYKGSLITIQYPKDVYYIYILFIFSGERTDPDLDAQKFKEIIPIFDQKSLPITDFLKTLLQNLQHIKKNKKFIKEYSQYHQKLEDIEVRISSLLDYKQDNKVNTISQFLVYFLSILGINLSDEDQDLNPTPSVIIPNTIPDKEPERKKISLINWFVLVLLLSLGGVIGHRFFFNKNEKVHETPLQPQDINNQWAEEPIEYLVKQQVLPMNSAGNFYPNKTMTIKEYATVLTRIFSLPACPNNFSLKTDNKNDQEDFKKAVCNNLLPNSQTVTPDNEVTRLLVLISLAEGAKLPKVNSSKSINFYKDIKEIEAKDKLIVAQDVKAGLMINYDNPCKIEPNKSATRAEVAAMVYQTLVLNNKAKPIVLAINPTLPIGGYFCYIQQLEARLPEQGYVNNEIYETKQLLMKKILSIKSKLQGVDPNILYDQKETKNLIDKAHSNYPFLIPFVPNSKLKKNQLRQLPNLEFEKNTTQQSESERIKDLKTVFKEVNLYLGEIDENFDSDLDSIIQQFQLYYMGMDAKANDLGIVGSKTWTALSPIFHYANLIVAYDYIMDNLESQSLKNILQNLNNCKGQGNVKYINCVKSLNSDKEE